MTERSGNWFAGIITVVIIVISILTARNFRKWEFSFTDYTGQRRLIEKNSMVGILPPTALANLSEKTVPRAAFWYRADNLFRDTNGSPLIYLVNDLHGTELTLSPDELQGLADAMWRIRVVPPEETETQN